MQTAKIFMNGGSQAVRLPKDCRFHCEEVVVKRLGEAVILVPKDQVWDVMMDGLNGFTDDIFEDGRDQGIPEKREKF